MHGGTSPGAPKGNRNAYRHGMRSAEATAMKAAIRALLDDARQTIESYGD